MCPDPFNDLIDIIFIGVALGFSLSFIKSVWFGPPDIFPLVLLTAWLILGEICYYFAPRHYVFVGFPRFYPSRYDMWKMEQAKTEKQKNLEKIQLLQNKKRVISIFDDLKDKGLISKDRKLEFKER